MSDRTLPPVSSRPSSDEQLLESPPPRVALFGDWGVGNLGDEAILEGAQRFLQDVPLEVVPFALGSLRPLDQGDALGGDALAIAGSGTLTTAWRARLPRPVWNAARASLRPVRNRLRARALELRVAECDVVVVGGGALLDDARNHFSDSLSRVARLSRRLRKPLICLGCSAVNEWSPRGRRQIGAFAERCDYIAVRDAETATRLSSLLERPVDVFGDFALWAPPVPTTSRPAEYATLGINVALRLDADRQLRLERAIATAARSWASAAPRRRLVVFTTGVTGDVEAARRVAAELDDWSPSLVVPQNLGELEELVASLSLAVAVRMHAGILCVGAGTPVLGVSVGTKLLSFFATANLADSVIVFDERCDGGAIAARLDADRLRDILSRCDVSSFRPARSEARRRLAVLSGAR